MKYSYNWLKELSNTKKSPQALAEVLNLRAFEVESVEKIKGDAVLEIKILADRGHDCLSHVGIAREICAIENRKLEVRSKKLDKKKSKMLSVKIEDGKLCSRYIGVMMNNIKVGSSPKWMRVKLEACGLRPINNIVDATNYVMLETGQPLHAFDFFKIKGEFPISNFQFPIKSKNPNIKIIIRKARHNEEIKLLDGTVKKLTSNDLVIADSKKALAIAGIKGGAEAEISVNTKAVVLEAANFNPTAIRKSRIRLGLKTDSSDRFEKGLDPNLAELAMARVIEIIEMMGGKSEGIEDIYPIKMKPWKIKLDLNYVNKLLGENIPVKTVIKILNSLELKIPHPAKATLSQRERGNIIFQIPTFRLDLRTQEDLIEEIGRIYGYEKNVPQAPNAPVKMPALNEERMFERKVKNILVGAGFSEVYNYSFYSQRDAGLAQLGTIKHLELENPMNPEQQYMRVSLIPNMLKNIRENLKYFKDFRIFEIGRVYWSDGAVLPREKRMLTGAIVLEKDKGSENFFEAKGYADNLLNKLGIKNFYYDDFNTSPIETFNTLWHEGRRAEIKIEGYKHSIGFLGEINPLILVDFDIHKRVACFEFDLDALRRDTKIEKEYEQIRKYPTVTRDISMIAAGIIKVADIIKDIKKTGGMLIQDIELFDIFQKENKTSFAFHVEFGADRTLENREVDALMQKIISALEKDLGVEVRKG